MAKWKRTFFVRKRKILGRIWGTSKEDPALDREIILFIILYGYLII